MQLGEQPAQPVLDGAIGLALATGDPLRLRGPLQGADLELALAAVKLGDPDAVQGAREQLSRAIQAQIAPNAPADALGRPFGPEGRNGRFWRGRGRLRAEGRIGWF